MMKKTFALLLFISLLLNFGLVYFFVFRGENIKLSDKRTEIKMSKEHADFVLSEMRGFLESVQQINYGILNNEPQKIIEAAEKSGGSVIAHAPKGFLKTIPLNFKNLGFKTHNIFDKIKENAQNNFDAKQSQKQLNELLQTCIACHRSFKITATKN